MSAPRPCPPSFAQLPPGVLVCMEGGQFTISLSGARRRQQPLHLSTPHHRYRIGHADECAALIVGQADIELAAWLGCDDLACLQHLGVLSADSAPAQDALEQQVIKHLLQCLRHNRMACRYPSLDVPGDDGDPRPGWVYNKYLAHSLTAYAEVIAVDALLLDDLQMAPTRWRAHWLGSQAQQWSQALREDLRNHQAMTGQRIWQPDFYCAFIAQHASPQTAPELL